MKPLYLRDRYSGQIRPRRASDREVAERIDAPEEGDELVRVTIDADGDMVATALSPDEIASLRASLDADRERALRELLDGALRMRRQATRLGGVIVNDAIVIEHNSAPWTEDVVRAWADDNSLVAAETPRPTKPEKYWQRAIHVYGDDVKPGDRLWPHEALVTLKWQFEDVNPEKDVAVEAALHGLAKTFNAENVEPLS